MPLLMKHAGPSWGIWKIEESSGALFSLLRNGEEYLPQLESIRTEPRRREWLASRVLLQELAGGPVRIAYRPNGAPYLPDSSLHVSISHTKGYAAVLLQDCPAAGIDIEYRSARVLKIRRRFMNPEEEAGIDKGHETEHLLLHWCAKETLFKMVGQEGGRLPSPSACPSVPVCGRRTFHRLRDPYGRRLGFRLNYLVTPDFVLTRS